MMFRLTVSNMKNQILPLGLLVVSLLLSGCETRSISDSGYRANRYYLGT